MRSEEKPAARTTAPSPEQSAAGQHQGSGTGEPSVSVIIPVRNEEACIEACLNSLVNQDYSDVVEILVVDGRSTDRTREIALSLAARHPLIQVLDNPKVLQAAALNEGIRRARGAIIVRADAHAIYEPDYVSQCVLHLQSTGAGNVGGPMRPLRSGGSCARAVAFCHETRFGIGAARFHSGDFEGFVDTVWLGAFWKDVLTRIGMFNEDLARTEDNDLNARLRGAGYKIFLTPTIRAHYLPRTGIRAFLKQYYSNGTGIGEALIARPACVSLRHLVPLGFLAALIACATGSGSPLGRGLLMAVLGLHLLVGFVVSVSAIGMVGLAAVFILPPLFLLLHITYGLGTVMGICRAIWNRTQSRAEG